MFVEQVLKHVFPVLDVGLEDSCDVACSRDFQNASRSFPNGLPKTA